jgi:hypothetical protein
MKKGEPLHTVFDNIRATIAALPENKPIIILETPPFKTDTKKNNSTKLLNKTLRTLQEMYPNVVLCEYRKDLEDIPIEEVMFDEIHIKRERPAKIITEKLWNIIQNTDITDSMTITRKYNIPEGKTGLLIGHKGTNLRRWTKEERVQITIKDDPTPTASLSGAEKDVNKVLNEMEAMIKNARERDQPHRPNPWGRSRNNSPDDSHRRREQKERNRDRSPIAGRSHRARHHWRETSH